MYPCFPKPSKHIAQQAPSSSTTSNTIRPQAQPAPPSSNPTGSRRANSASFSSRNLPLDLHIPWFTAEPPAFPPPTLKSYGRKINFVAGTTITPASSTSPRLEILILHMRFNDTLEATRLRIIWDDKNPLKTVKAEQKHYPHPRKLTKEELGKYRGRYAEDVAKWCESQLGMKVGDGECWTLPRQALKAVAQECLKRGKEPCMISQGLNHGFLILSLPLSESTHSSNDIQKSIKEAGVARGDIVQLLNTTFESENGDSVSDSKHTVVITGVDGEGKMSVVGQNEGGGVKRRTVKKSVRDLKELKTGRVYVYRVVCENWIGKLEARW